MIRNNNVKTKKIKTYHREHGGETHSRADRRHLKLRIVSPFLSTHALEESFREDNARMSHGPARAHGFLTRKHEWNDLVFLNFDRHGKISNLFPYFLNSNSNAVWLINVRHITPQSDSVSLDYARCLFGRTNNSCSYDSM